jgi:hypothetical protein
MQTVFNQGDAFRGCGQRMRPQIFEAEDFGAEFTPELRAQEERIRAQTGQLAKGNKR